MTTQTNPALSKSDPLRSFFGAEPLPRPRSALPMVLVGLAASIATLPLFLVIATPIA